MAYLGVVGKPAKLPMLIYIVTLGGMRPPPRPGAATTGDGGAGAQSGGGISVY